MSGIYEEQIGRIENQLETLTVFTEGVSKNTKNIQQNMTIITIILIVTVIIGMLFRK